MKKTFPWFWTCLAFSVIFIGCGGGGGDSAPPAPAIVYTGLTTPAVITAANANELALDAYEGSNLTPVGAVTSGGASKPLYKRITTLVNRTAEFQIGSSSVVTAAQVTKSQTVNGTCGGTQVTTITYDDVTGNYTGTVTFTNYCDDGDVTNGVASVSGIYDLVNDTLLTIIMSTSSINISGAVNLTIKGTFSMNFQTGFLGITDFYVRDNNSGKVEWVPNFTITSVEGGGGTYTDLTMTGRYYNPDYGYVDLTTTTSIRQYTDLPNPSSGILLLTGAPGSAGGNTKAQLVFLSSSSYEVDADTNGDDSWDWNSGTKNW